MTEMSTTRPTNGQYHHTDLPDAELVSLIERLRLEKKAGVWALPNDVRADDTKVSRLVEAIVKIEAGEPLQTTELTTYGLSPPRHTVTVTLAWPY